MGTLFVIGSKTLNEINTIQKLLLLNKELETILNEHLPKHFKVKDLTTLTKIL